MKNNLSFLIKSMTIFTCLDLLTTSQKDDDKILDPLLLRTGLALLVGSSDVGKTSFLRELAVSIVKGKSNVFGYPLKPLHKRVMYISTEDSPSDQSSALKKMIPREDYDEMKRIDFVFNFSMREIETIRDRLSKQPVDLIIIDCWGDLIEGNPNDFTSIRRSFLPLKRLANDFNCLVMLLHHTVKNSEKNGSDKKNVSGSQAIEAVPRIVLELRQGSNLDERVLKILKCNYLGGRFKKQAWIYTFEEETLTFRPKIIENDEHKARTKYSNPLLITSFLKLKAEGLSFDKCRLMLIEEFDEANVPGITRLKEIYYETVGSKIDNDLTDETA